MSKRTAQPGSISHGTMRLEDLIPTFAEELHSLGRSFPRETEIVMAYLAKLDNGETDNDPTMDELSYLVLEDLFDRLDKCAPEEHYFGVHVGDGTDYGFWPTDDVDY